MENNNSKEQRINNAIRAERVRVIDANGNMLGILSIREAMLIANAAGLDLVEVNSDSLPPVCKILDYGKMRYQAQKRKNLAKKNQHTVEVKEIQLRPAIAKNDYQVKLNNAKRFLEKGNKVKIVLQFKGRELAHQEIGEKVVVNMINELAEHGKPEKPLKSESRKLIVVIAPIKQAIIE